MKTARYKIQVSRGWTGLQITLLDTIITKDMGGIMLTLLICTLFVTATLAVPKLTKPEADCLKKEKFYHEESDKCYNLLTQGPCKKGEWFVLRKPLPDDKSTIIKAVCEKDRCGDVGYFWPGKGCVTSREKGALCGEEETVTLENNDFGEGECNCIKIPLHGRLNDDPKNKCYQLYRKGPCPLGQVLGVPDNGVSPVCMPYPCFNESVAMKLDGKLPLEATLAMYNGSCHQLNSQGPCPANTILKVSVSTRQPECVNLPNSIFNLEKPQDCEYDSNGRCQITVQIDDSDSSYHQSVLATLAQQKQRHRQLQPEPTKQTFTPTEHEVEELIEIIV